jgi:integrase
MSVQRIRNHGACVWRARVAIGGLRKAAVRPTKAAALDAEAELRRELQQVAKRGRPRAGLLRLSRLRLHFYEADMRARGKGEESVARVDYTRRVIETHTPALLEVAVGRITDGDLFAFRAARSRAGAKPGTINRDLRTLRAALKKARPDYRFPGGAFFLDDETRVRWLRPEDELLVFETMASPFREIARLAALTLMRMSEIRTLRRDAVHLEQGVVMLPRAKAGARPMILNAAAQKVLRDQLDAHPHSELVFAGPRGRPYSREQIGKAFRRAARAAGLRDFRSTTCATTGRRWRSTGVSRRRS